MSSCREVNHPVSFECISVIPHFNSCDVSLDSAYGQRCHNGHRYQLPGQCHIYMFERVFLGGFG